MTVDRVQDESPLVFVLGETQLAERVRSVLGTEAWASVIRVKRQGDAGDPDLVIATEPPPENIVVSYPGAAFLFLAAQEMPGALSDIDATDSLTVSFSDSDLKGKVLGLLSRRGHLLLLVQEMDTSATRLALTESCEWIRSRISIVGLVRLERRSAPPSLLRTQVARQITSAHALLDSLPETAFTLNDAWNLLLFVSLPWSEEEAVGDETLFDILSGIERDLRGSRKVLLWRGVSPTYHLGKFHHDAATWVPSSPDPLRDEVSRIARDSAEAMALRTLFQARIVETDFEHLIDILARDPNDRDG